MDSHADLLIQQPIGEVLGALSSTDVQLGERLRRGIHGLGVEGGAARRIVRPVEEHRLFPVYDRRSVSVGKFSGAVREPGTRGRILAKGIVCHIVERTVRAIVRRRPDGDRGRPQASVLYPHGVGERL